MDNSKTRLKDKLYFFDFILNLFQERNWIVIPFMIINMIVFSFVFGIIYVFICTILSIKVLNADYLIFVAGAILYLLSLIVAMSPIGEWILRELGGYTKIERADHINRIEPLFYDVYQNARKVSTNISPKVVLYMCEDSVANAMAMGRNTICITTGLLNETDEIIKAALAHEFGHLAGCDPYLNLVIEIGNLLNTSFIKLLGLLLKGFFWVFMTIFSIIGGMLGSVIGGIGGALSSVMNVLLSLVISALNIVENIYLFIWNGITNLLFSSILLREDLQADAFAFDLGYGKELCEIIDSPLIGGEDDANIQFAYLKSDKVSTSKRIAQLQKMGVQYDGKDAK